MTCIVIYVAGKPVASALRQLEKRDIPASLSNAKALSEWCTSHLARHPSASYEAAATGSLANGQGQPSLGVGARGFPVFFALEPRHYPRRIAPSDEFVSPNEFLAGVETSSWIR